MQRGGSLIGLDSDGEHNSDDAGIIDDIKQLLTDLIGDVVQNTDSENNCTRMPLKRRAQDIIVSSYEPKHKRPFSTVTERTVFNPVTEHHLWCPYVSDIVCDGPNNVARDKPWLRLLRQLVPDPHAGLSHVQTSPVPVGIERIRKLFRTWTSSV